MYQVRSILWMLDKDQLELELQKWMEFTTSFCWQFENNYPFLLSFISCCQIKIVGTINQRQEEEDTLGWRWVCVWRSLHPPLTDDIVLTVEHKHSLTLARPSPHWQLTDNTLLTHFSLNYNISSLMNYSLRFHDDHQWREQKSKTFLQNLFNVNQLKCHMFAFIKKLFGPWQGWIWKKVQT